jgi:hypothetical protein
MQDLKLLKPSSNYVPPALTVCVLPTKCVSQFCTILKANLIVFLNDINELFVVIIMCVFLEVRTNV